MVNDKKSKVLDLFCGAGGMSKGFEMAGFKILAGNDNWKASLETFKLNHPEAVAIYGDITKKEVRDEIIKAVDRNVDVIIGGPPCQAYSLAGKRDPTDPRGKLFEQYVKIVKEINPKFFVMENVKGILTMWHYKENLTDGDIKERDDILKSISELIKERRSLWNGNNKEERNKKRQEIATKLAKLRREIKKLQEPVTELIKREFKKIGYNVEFELFDVADFGVPQTRKRVIFIGAKKKSDIVFPQRTHSNRNETDLFGRKLRPHVTLEEAIGRMGNPHQNPNDEVYDGSFSTIYMSRNRRKDWNDISFTIQAGSRHTPLHPSSSPMRFLEKDKWEFSNPKDVRRFSFLECARIQTFPEDYKFVGNIHSKIKQIGNAVPPLFAKRIAEALMNKISETDVC